MTRRRRVLVWIRICREAWSMLGDGFASQAVESGVAVRLQVADGGPSVTAPQFVLRPDVAIMSVERGVRETTKPGDLSRTYELYEDPETVLLAYGRRAPERVTS